MKDKGYKNISQSNFHKAGVLRFGMNESFTHRLAKFLLLNEALEHKHTVFTECIFNNGSRADLFLSDLNEAWEVLETESIEKFKKEKEDKYPCRVIPFNAIDIIKKNKELRKIAEWF